jgi:predicted porin
VAHRSTATLQAETGIANARSANQYEEIFDMAPRLTRSAICMAALALTSYGALAQSNVVVFGIVDVGVERIGGVAVGTAKENSTRVTGSNQIASRWGFRGSEDLGGGLKAVFHLESGFAPDTGTLMQNGRLFGREATVGLAGSWGQLNIGHQRNAIFDLHLVYSPMSYTSYGTAAADNAFFTQRADNSVKYTFKRGAFTTQWIYSVGRDALAGTPAGSQSEVPGNSKIGRQWGGNGTYAEGPLSVSLGYDSQNGTTAALAPQTDSRAYAAAKYNIKGDTLYVGMMRRYNDIPVIDTVNDLTWVGIRHPFTEKFGVTGWVFQTKLRRSADKANVVGASLFYDFSKRSQGYLNVAYASNDGASRQGVASSTPALPGGTQNGVALGIAHTF